MDLTIENLRVILDRSGSVERGADQLKAEEVLKQWEIVPRFHYLLQSVYLDVSLPLQTRWLSVILFKNGIDKYWRLSRKNSITKEEKQLIRQRLFDIVDEQNNQLTIQNAHSIAKICRFDFPAEWSTFFEDFETVLQDSIKSNHLVKLNNLLLVLNQTIKALASVRIGRTRAAMQLKSPSLTLILIKLYINCFNSWTENLDLAVMEVGYLCLKNLRRIIVDGFEYPNRNEHVVEFFQISIDHFRKLIGVYENDQVEILAKYLGCFNKLYLNLINVNPTSFVLIPSSLDILGQLLSMLESKLSVVYSSEDDDFWQKMAIQIMMIMKKLLAFSTKQGAVMIKLRNDKSDIESATLLLQNKLFVENNIKSLVLLLINWYLKLKDQDLESWTLEPEEWVSEEATLSWEFQLRPCSENLFQDLSETFPELLSSFILQQISERLSSSLDILTKDAILAAFQLSSLSISKIVNFDQLLVETFIPEALRSDSPETKILKRRILLIIQDWMDVKYSKETRNEVYQLLLKFLTSSDSFDDVVVKLSSCQALKKIIDDWDFDKNEFKPFVNQFLSSLLLFLKVLKLPETKSFILELLSSMIIQTTSIIPVETLLELLEMIPNIWALSGDSNELTLKQSSIRLLNNLVIALGDQSVKSYDISIPVLLLCCDEKSDLYNLLSEDGFELWNSIMVHYPSAGNELPNRLIEPCNMLLDALQNSTEILSTILKIIRDYALIDSRIFNTDEFGVKYFSICLNYLNQFRDDCLLIFLSTIEILVLRKQNFELFGKLVETGLLAQFYDFITSTEVSTVTTSNKALTIVSRLFFETPELALSAFHSQENLVVFIRLWISRISTNSELRNKKIFILGLISFFTIALLQSDEMILQLFGSFVQILTQFLEEVHENEKGDCDSYQQGFLFEEYNYTFEETSKNGEYLRCENLYTTQDPVHQTKLTTVFKKLLVEFQVSNEQLFEKVMNQYIDVPTMDQLKLMIS